MFTGIIEAVAKVDSITAEKDGGARMLFRAPWSASSLELGESIAVNGACLTIAELLPRGESSELLFFMSAETLSRTNLSELRTGSFVNLERALRADARLSGHIVQGHVDGMGRVSRLEHEEGSYLLEVDLPSSVSKYCVEKGSICLNGVSLTINGLRPLADGARVLITLIPHTWTHTSFSKTKIGDAINVEVDVLAKYVEKLCQPYLNAKSRSNG